MLYKIIEKIKKFNKITLFICESSLKTKAFPYKFEKWVRKSLVNLICWVCEIVEWALIARETNGW